MQVVRDRADVAAIADAALRTLVEERVQALADEYANLELHELVTFVIVEAGDTLAAIDAQLGFSIVDALPELVEQHGDYFEIVIVVSDDGYGVEVFVPINADVPPELVALCTQ